MDQLTLLENKLEEKFNLAVARIADSGFVVSWDDYQHRAGYIKALRDIGQIIKEVRNPETAQGEGGIPSILDQVEQTNG